MSMLLSQACLQVDKALKPISSPAALAANAAWILTTHAGLGFVAPFFGPPLESLTRGILLLVRNAPGLASAV